MSQSLPADTEDGSRHWIAKNLPALAILFVVWLVYAGPLLSPRTTLFLTDTFCLDVPNHIYVAKLCRQGVFPTWTPLLQCGFPLFAGGQTGILYPFFAMFAICPSPETNDIFVALHFLLVGLCMYLFLADLVARPAAAACGAITFMIGGYLQTTHVVPSIVSTMMLLSLCLFAIGRWASGSATAAWWCGLLNAAAIFESEFTITRLSLVLQFVYFLWRGRDKKLTERVLAIGPLFVLPFALAAVQIVPLYVFFTDGTRAAREATGLDWNAFSNLRLQWRFLLTFFYPDLFGTPWALQVPYVLWEESLLIFHGYAAVVLMPLGIATSRRLSEPRFWTVMLLAGVLLATATPLYRIMFYLPVYNWFRFPAHQVLFSSVAVAVLTAYGADWLMQRLAGARRDWRARLLPYLVVACCGLGIHRTLANYTAPTDFYQTHAPEILAAARRPEHFRLRPLTFALYDYASASEERLRRNAAALPANYSLLFNVPSATSIGQENESLTEQASYEVISLQHENSLKLMAVTHLSSSAPLEKLRSGISTQPIPPYVPPDEVLEPIASGKCYFYRYRHAMPRAWMVYQARSTPDAQERLRIFASDEFDPSMEALVETDLQLGPAPATPPRVLLQEPDPTSLVVEVETGCAGLLVIADTYSADFETRLDGSPVALLRANHAFRGVAVPAGRHRIEMQHRPRSLRIGLGVSMAALTIAVAGLWRSHRRARAIT